MASDGEEEGRRVLLRIVLLLRFLESFSYYTLNNVFTLHLTEVLGMGAH